MADSLLTFAFTDIEGSTARWERDRAAMQDAVRRHDAILRTAITEHGGHVFKTIGDAFCSAFARPENAVAAMLAAQEALNSEDFSAVDDLRVRAALHTGAVEAREGDYFGPPLNKVARLLAIGHGGQILVTEETAALIGGMLPGGGSLRDLGAYHLKDFPEPQRVHQLLAPTLPAEFPPLRSLGTLPSDLSIVDSKEFHPVPSFSGRDDELAAVQAALERDGAIAVVHGMGGLGKSSVAREYGWRNRERYSVAWWLNAQTEDGIIDGLLRLGSMFVHGLDQLKDRRAAANRVLHSVLGGFDKPVLLVFDNLEDEALMRAWLPRSGTRALATSRDAAWSTDVTPVALQTWSLETAAEYLQRSSGRTDLTENEARAIALALGALPLAVAHAASTLRNLRMVGVQRYIDHINDHLRKAPRGADYPRSVFATFRIAIAQAEQQAPGAAAVLCFASSFAPDAIPDELFRQAIDFYPTGLRPNHADGTALDLRSAVADELRLDEALGALDRLSLLAFAQNSRTYGLHRLVQLAAQDLAGDGARAWRECAVSAVNAAFPERMEYTNWPRCESLLPHARAALEAIPVDIAFLPAVHLEQRCSQYLYRRGEYDPAVGMGEHSLANQEKALGPDHLGVAASLTDLGYVYWAQGKFPEAESLFSRSLAIREKALGPEHDEVAKSVSAVGLIYNEEGRYAEAEPLFLRALAIWEKTRSPDLHYVSVCLNNLGIVLENTGRYAEAERLYTRAHEIREQVYGSEHPHIAFGLNNLAGMHRMRGRYDEAERLCIRSIEIREKALGPDHPELAMSLNHLALITADLGRFAEAEALHLRALAIREKAFGPDRPDVAQSLNNLGALYRSQGRLADAESLLVRAISIRETTLGHEHPELADSLANLADIHRLQGRYGQAEPLLSRALAIREKKSGSDHSEVAPILNVVALVHADQGRYEEAEATHLCALAIREKAFEPDHPEVAQSLNNLADVYRLQGRSAEAESLLARALSIRHQALGPEHPDVTESLRILGEVRRSQGRHDEAEPLLARAFAICEKSLGADHPATSAARKALEAHRSEKPVRDCS